MTKTKSNIGNFFEDFSLGQIIRTRRRARSRPAIGLLHRAVFAGLAVQSSRAFAQAIGYKEAPIDDILVFHFVLGKTVPDVSLNAIANLGYADFKFLAPVYPGDTLTATSEVIGLKEISIRRPASFMCARPAESERRGRA